MHSIFVIKRKFYISQTEMTKIYLSLLIIFHLSLFFLFLFSIYFAFSFERDIFIRLFPNPRIINNIENFEQLRNNQEVASIIRKIISNWFHIPSLLALPHWQFNSAINWHRLPRKRGFPFLKEKYRGIFHVKRFPCSIGVRF